MYLDLIESNWICLYKSYERIKDVGTPHWKQRNDHHFLFKTSSSACDCKRFPSHQCIAMTGCGVRWWYEMCERICDMQEINQINSLPAHRIMVRTAGQTDSQKRTKLADCLLIWQIGRKCSISISEWLFFLAATFGSQGATGGSNSQQSFPRSDSSVGARSSLPVDTTHNIQWRYLWFMITICYCPFGNDDIKELMNRLIIEITFFAAITFSSAVVGQKPCPETRACVALRLCPKTAHFSPHSDTLSCHHFLI